MCKAVCSGIGLTFAAGQERERLTLGLFVKYGRKFMPFVTSSTIEAVTLCTVSGFVGETSYLRAKEAYLAVFRRSGVQQTTRWSCPHLAVDCAPLHRQQQTAMTTMTRIMITMTRLAAIKIHIITPA